MELQAKIVALEAVKTENKDGDNAI